MTDDYNLAKPDPFATDPQTGLPPYMVDVNLPDGEVVMGDPAHIRTDHTGFVPGQDRMLSAPEFLARSRGHQPPDGPRLSRPIPHARSANQFCVLCESGEHFPITSETSDGYHTFRELYDHRRALTAALMRMVVDYVWREEGCWRSRNHHPEDGPMFEGSFIVGIDLPNGTISYHYNNQFWDDFSHVRELPHAPKWDGAGPELTVTRLLDFARR